MTPMSIIETIVAEVIKRVLNRHGSKSDPPQWSADRIRLHLVDVANWSSRIEFLGLAEARATDRDTIALFTSLPRKFRGDKTNVTMSDETDLRLAPGNVVLLGDPGAGKTTTIKRIARALLDAPTALEDTAEYPILVRLRDIDADMLLEEAIGYALGLPVTREIVKAPREAHEDEGLSRRREADTVRILCNMKPALDIFAEIASDSRAMLLFNGLDEIRPELRTRTEDAIIQLARKSDSINARIRVTCRSGDYTRQLEGFDTLELCPLDETQIAEVIARWCSDPGEFTGALNVLPFKDLATRPLFLCELIVLFEKSGFLPLSPSAVYRRIVLLALEEWDRSKRLLRRSRYAGFDPARKFDFLAHLAFHLTYIAQQKHFTPQSFALAYESIRHQFGLPPGEAQQVFTELESHTGILIQVGYERYEFSHLSLQEFLAADYLLRDRISDATARQMEINPAPLAVSVAMSSNPSQRIAGMFLLPSCTRALSKLNFESFFSRLEQEGTTFQADIALGFAALAVIFASTALSPLVERFLSAEVVEKSVAIALKAFYAKGLPERESTVMLHLRDDWDDMRDFVLPAVGRISGARLYRILDNAGLRPPPVELGVRSGVSLQRYIFSGRRVIQLERRPNPTQEQTGGCCRGSALKRLALLEFLVSGRIGGLRAACCSASTR